MSSIHNLSRAQVKALAQSPQVPIIEQPPRGLPLHQVQQRKLKLTKNYQFIKRSIDIGVGLLGLLLLLLLLPFIAIFILGEDRGPIFYKQERIGQYGRPFQTYKLRSMVANADEYLAQHPELLRAWQHNGKLQDDPRITQTGKFLRHTSLDELPQVVNVLRGDMSLVGPRAIQAAEVAAFGELGELRHARWSNRASQASGRSAGAHTQRMSSGYCSTVPMFWNVQSQSTYAFLSERSPWLYMVKGPIRILDGNQRSSLYSASQRSSQS